MGGASAQIAFEIPADISFSSENIQILNLGSHDNDMRFVYSLFVTTFLGYGVNEASKKYEIVLREKMSSYISHRNSTPIPYVEDGCLPSKFFKLATDDDGAQFVRKVYFWSLLMSNDGR